MVEYKNLTQMPILKGIFLSGCASFSFGYGPHSNLNDVVTFCKNNFKSEIPQGFTIAIESENSIKEYWTLKVTNPSTLTIADFVEKLASGILGLIADMEKVKRILGDLWTTDTEISFSLDDSDAEDVEPGDDPSGGDDTPSGGGDTPSSGDDSGEVTPLTYTLNLSTGIAYDASSDDDTVGADDGTIKTYSKLADAVVVGNGYTKATVTLTNFSTLSSVGILRTEALRTKWEGLQNGVYGDPLGSYFETSLLFYSNGTKTLTVLSGDRLVWISAHGVSLQAKVAITLSKS